LTDAATDVENNGVFTEIIELERNLAAETTVYPPSSFMDNDTLTPDTTPASQLRSYVKRQLDVIKRVSDVRFPWLEYMAILVDTRRIRRRAIELISEPDVE